MSALETIAFDRSVRTMRIEELAAQSTEGALTEAEQAEYEGYVRANKRYSYWNRSPGEWMRQ